MILQSWKAGQVVSEATGGEQTAPPGTGMAEVPAKPSVQRSPSR